jgi:hypothetical protein
MGKIHKEKCFVFGVVGGYCCLAAQVVRGICEETFQSFFQQFLLRSFDVAWWNRLL